MAEYDRLRSRLADSVRIAEPFELLRRVAAVVAATPPQGRDLVIRLLDRRSDLPEQYHQILDDLVLATGLYPYVDEASSTALPLRSALEREAHRAEGALEGYTLHRSQYAVYQRLLAGESIILSAPTSYGKSLLIDAVLAAREFECVVVIVPTIALIDETRRRLSRLSYKYDVITAAGERPSGPALYVLTQERYLSVADDLPKPDFFVIDEFYKLSPSSDGSRSATLNHVFRQLEQTGAQFYLLGPSVSRIPDHLEATLDCSFVVDDFQTVAIDTIHLEKTPSRESVLHNIWPTLSGQTLIYCKSPASTRRLLSELIELGTFGRTDDSEILSAANWTATNYHRNWLVSQGLRHGVGIHHGRIPRALARFMVRMFEQGKLNPLICTSTLIEGVNTSARNVVVFDNKLGRSKLDYFTFSNIRGRTGRMFRHFLGNIYLFHDEPKQELPFVDVPAYNPTKETPSSLLLQFETDSLPEEAQQKVRPLLSQTVLPVSLLVENRSVEPEFLVATARAILSMPQDQADLLVWTGLPTYEQLHATSKLIYGPMGGKAAAQRAGIRSQKQLTFFMNKLSTFRDASRFRRWHIADQVGNDQDPDDAVENTLTLLRNWASYNYPNLLVALDAVGKVSLARRGLGIPNYLPFAASMENLFRPSAIKVLEEYGLPTELSSRMLRDRLIDREQPLSSVLRTLQGSDLDGYGHDEFERGMLRDFVAGLE